MLSSSGQYNTMQCSVLQWILVQSSSDKCSAVLWSDKESLFASESGCPMVVSGPMHCNGGDKVRWPGTCSKVSLGIIYRYYMQVLSAGSIFGYYLKVLSIVIIYRKPFPGNIYISTGIIYRYFLQILSTDIIYKYYLQILSTDIIYRYYK